MDQRGERKMTIGGVDVKGTEDIKNQEEKKEQWQGQWQRVS